MDYSATAYDMQKHITGHQIKKHVQDLYPFRQVQEQDRELAYQTIWSSAKTEEEAHKNIEEYIRQQSVPVFIQQLENNDIKTELD